MMGGPGGSGRPGQNLLLAEQGSLDCDWDRDKTSAFQTKQTLGRYHWSFFVL